MTLLYIGDGSYIPGVPARNLTADEVATQDKAALLATGLYKEPAKKPAGKSKKATTDAAKGE